MRAVRNNRWSGLAQSTQENCRERAWGQARLKEGEFDTCLIWTLLKAASTARPKGTDRRSIQLRAFAEVAAKGKRSRSEVNFTEVSVSTGSKKRSEVIILRWPSQQLGTTIVASHGNQRLAHDGNKFRRVRVRRITGVKSRTANNFKATIVEFMPKFSVRGTMQRWQESYPNDENKADDAITVFTSNINGLVTGDTHCEGEADADLWNAARDEPSMARV
ncbi:Malonate--CoA ligase [Nymphaea thermarum]|nr:Malonate--CoA ligase [Nymphaea thermarum]